MRALGLTVEIPTPGRPVIRAVLLDDPLGAADTPALGDVTIFSEFDLTTAEAGWAGIASQYFQDVSGRVSTLAPDVVVIRRADVYAKGRIGDGPRLRLVVEGAITAAAVAHVANTHLRTGGDCARKYGQDKDVMDADGRTLVTKKARTEAAGAALSGLFGNRT